MLQTGYFQLQRLYVLHGVCQHFALACAHALRIAQIHQADGDMYATIQAAIVELGPEVEIERHDVTRLLKEEEECAHGCALNSW